MRQTGYPDRLVSDVRPNEVALYPLPVVIFPAGRQRLRVFESTAQSVISAACKRGEGFVIAFQPATRHSTDFSSRTAYYSASSGLDSSSHALADGVDFGWGVQVAITDFGYGEDGILTLDVLAEQLVTIKNTYQNSHGEWFGCRHYVPHWTMLDPDSRIEPLSQTLHQLFLANREIAALYSETYFERPDWVCARLIELLPVPYENKLALLKADSFQQAVGLLSQILEKS